MACARRFSTQTFDTTYWLRRPELQRPLHDALVACSGLRQAGRSLAAAPSTMQRQASRLGRHCLLLQWSRARRRLPTETLVLDGLVSFEYSQYWPFELNVLVGATTGFFYGFTQSELRRSGRMTSFQKARRERLEARFRRPERRATERAVQELVSMVAPQAGTLTILSDEHVAYPRAFRRLPHDIEHRAFTSRRQRWCRNPLHPVDHLDALIRHSSANHKRETIAFSKRRQAAMERAAVFQAWRNFIKRRSEKVRTSSTPAQALGLTNRPLTVDDLLERRLFPSRVPVPPPVADVYWRRIPTRQVPNGTTHALRYAA